MPRPILTKEDKEFVKQVMRDTRNGDIFSCYEDMRRFINLMYSVAEHDYRSSNSVNALCYLIKHYQIVFKKDEDGDYNFIFNPDKFHWYLSKYLLNKVGYRNKVKILFNQGKFKTFTLPFSYCMFSLFYPNNSFKVLSEKIKYCNDYELREIKEYRNTYGYVEGFSTEWIPFIPLQCYHTTRQINYAYPHYMD